MERFLSQDRRGEGDKGEGAARGFGARDKVEKKREEPPQSRID